MSITTLYREYFQKSRVFLYPMLNMKYGTPITPDATYVGWEGLYEPEDKKLVCIFNINPVVRTKSGSIDTLAFRNFEKTKLFGNPLFCDFKIVGEETAAYIFDFSDYKQDWHNFMLGKYSRLSDVLKKRIKDHWGSDTSNYTYVESYIYPNRFMSIYAELLNVSEEHLRSIGELCDKPDMDKEILKINVRDLQIDNHKQ